jgi:flavin prenyltransferase
LTATPRKKRFIVGITGSSAPHYGISLLRALRDAPDVEVHLVMSEGAIVSMRHEVPEVSREDIAALADVVHDNKNLAAGIASGSFITAGMVVVPCSMNTLSAIAHSLSANLLTRAADVCLKERRRLVLVPRETPLHRGHLENMLRATDMGAIIAPPAPAFYHRPKTIDDIVNHTTGKILDLLGVEHRLFERWSTKTPD